MPLLELLFGRLAKHWRWVRFMLDVQARFWEVKGGYLASAVSLPLFLGVFPMLLVAIAVLGFVTSNNVDFVYRTIAEYIPERVVLSRVDAVLDAAVASRRTASVVGFVLLVWSGLSVAAAIGYAVDSAWQIKGRGIIERLPGLVWGVGAALILAATVGVTTVVDVYSGGLANIAVMAAGVLLNTLFFLWTFHILTSRRLPIRAHLPGAIVGGFFLEVLKQLVRTLPGVLSQPAAIWGSIGVVFAILVVLTVFGRIVVYTSVLNVVRWEGKHGTRTMAIDVPYLPGPEPSEVTRVGTQGEFPDDNES